MAASLLRAAAFGAFAFAWVHGANAAEAPAPKAETAPTSATTPVPVAGEEGFVNPFQPVESQELSKLSGQDVGLLTPETGGFSADLWQGADRLLIEILLPRFRAAAGSPAASDLARRLVLTRAPHPQGATRGVSLAGARLAAIYELGGVALIEPIVAQVPSEAGNADIIAVRTDALFLQGLAGEGCGLAESVRGRVSDAAWVKRLAFCDGLAGRIPAARIGVDLLSEMGEADAAFTILMSRLVDKGKALPKDPFVPKAVHFALALATAAALPDGAIALASPSVATAYAAHEKAPAPQRALAAERAIASGALPPAALRARYEAIEIPAKDLAATPDLTALAPGVKTSALLWRRLGALTDQRERAAVITAMLKTARARGAHAATAFLVRDQIAGLQAESALAPIAAELGAAEALAGEGILARRWYDLLKAEGRESNESAQALKAILAIRTLNGELAQSDEALLARIQSARGDSAKARAGLEIALAEALGAGRSEARLHEVLVGPLSAQGDVPVPALLDRLDRAGRSGVLGEAALLSLIVLGAGGPGNAHPIAVTAAVRSLAAAGLESEARSIAAEALIARLP